MRIKIATIALILLTSSAEAEPTAIQQTAKAVRQNYDNCFYESAGSMIRSKVSNDINSIAEQAFLACQTEEQALYGLMAVNHVPQNQASAMVVGIKLQLKRALKEIAADPAKFLRAPASR